MAAEKAQQSDQDQVQGHDVIEQSWNDQYEDAGNQRDERPNGEIEIDGSSFFSSESAASAKTFCPFASDSRVIPSLAHGKPPQFPIKKSKKLVGSGGVSLLHCS